MDLNLFKNLENDLNTNEELESFSNELHNYLEQENKLEENENRKEGHLYLVTEDRNGEVYLWDFTDKSEIEFVETELPPEVLAFATEGAMLQYKDGKYILYSPDGYDILDAEEDNLDK